MRRFISKVKSKLSSDENGRSSDLDPLQEPARPPADDRSKMQPPTALDILRYRYQYGVNLGGVYVLEKWISPSMFESWTKEGSELDALTACINEHGLLDAQNKWRYFYACALSDIILDYLVHEAHITAIRLPIGYFSLAIFADHTITHNTPFAAPITSVYDAAWLLIVDSCAKLFAHGIGILIDLHALPGGANDQDHSGTSSHKAELWENPKYLKTAKFCATWLATQVKNEVLKGCIGIQLCNEACAGAKGLFEWYGEVIDAVSEIDVSIPLYISDAWDLPSALNFAGFLNAPESPVNPVIVATSRYYVFTHADRARSPQETLDLIDTELSECDTRARDICNEGARQVAVTEWSCASPSPQPLEWMQQFGQTQCRRWRARSSGCFFWTLKRENSEKGDGWSFLEMSKEGCMAAPTEYSLSFEEVRARMQEADSERKGLKMRDVTTHTAYWSTRGKGWDWGWDDARAFWGMRACSGTEEAKAEGVGVGGMTLGGQSVKGQKTGGDFIGAVEVWVWKRLKEWMAESGTGEREKVPMREWERGFREGVAAFEGVIRRPSRGVGRGFGVDGEEGFEGEEGDGEVGGVIDAHGGEQANRGGEKE